MSADDSTRMNPQPVTLSDEEEVKKIIVGSVFHLWSAVNDLTKIRPSRRERYRVTIFGSARAKPQTFVYDEVKRLAEALSAMDCDIVTGGGPGLMQAANEGAASAAAPGGKRSLGIRVDLPFEQEVNPFVQQGFEHGTFFTRLHHFVLVSDAFIVVPGGIGTALEALMVWQLLQVNHLKDTPLILVGKMWAGLVDWAREHMLSFHPPLANTGDMDIPQCVDNADEAISLIRENRARWRISNRESHG